MIRAKRTPRPDTCCSSADVVTPTERAAERPEGFTQPRAMVYRDGGKKWGDVPKIRELLMSLGKAK
jgi:hypothetical protein